MLFAKTFWPDVTFYRQQQEIIYSVVDNSETYVPAGNELGKDFVAGFIALWWFCSRRPARVVTTSVKMDQLEDVLWGEIRRFIQTAQGKLPIQYNHMKIRQVDGRGRLYPNSELVGQVSNTKEGLLGRHSTQGFKPIQGDIPRTLVIFDEASGIDDDTYNSTQTWADRKLIIGNPFPCSNFFKRGVKAGDLSRPPRRDPRTGKLVSNGYVRKVIQIKAADSPNVRYAEAEIARGREPSDRIIIPGVKSWSKLQENLLTWDKVLKCVGIDAEFYEGAEVLLFPPDWLNAAEERHRQLVRLGVVRRAEAIGIDPAEGGDRTAMCAVDRFGIIELVSRQTPNTAVAVNEAIAFILRHNLQEHTERVMVDRGGGGNWLAGQLKERGYEDIRTVGFGEPVTIDPRRGIMPISTRKEHAGVRYAFKNRRAQLYGTLSAFLDPSINVDDKGHSRVFAIPTDDEKCKELRRQLAVIPKLYDKEGRLELPPKRKAGTEADRMRNPGAESQKKVTLEELIGCSPDEADAAVLALHGMVDKPLLVTVGALA